MTSIRLDLQPPTIEELRRLKKATGAGSYAEVIRMALRQLSSQIPGYRADTGHVTGE